MNDAYFSAFSFRNMLIQQWFMLNNSSTSPLKQLFAAVILISSFQNVFASNYLYEYEFSEALKKQIPEKQFVWLDSGTDRDTLSLLIKSQSPKAKGAIIILPEIGHHPDWPNVIHDLRYTLAQYGWATLSVQMPVDVELNYKQAYEDVYQTVKKRTIAAIKYIQENSPDYIVLLARGKSANFAIRYIAEMQNLEQATQAAHALVFIGAFDSAYLKTSDYMKSIAIPMLDIFAEKDHKYVLESATARVVAARFAAKLKSDPQNLTSSHKVQQLIINKTGNLRFRQIVIPGANALFTAQSDTLIKAIRGWLQVHSSQKKVVVQN